MKEFFATATVPFIILVLALGVTFWLGALAGRDVGRQEVREQVAKRSLGQFYTDPQTGKVDFQYLDLQAYTNSLIQAFMPQRVPGPPVQ